MLTASTALSAEDKFDRDLQAGGKVWTLLLALHNYHDTHGMFPEAYSYDRKAGRALLSWRVQLLPFVGHAELYRKFKQNEPWDSEHNKALIAEMPANYAAPGGADRDKGKTCYLTIRADDSAFPAEKRIGLKDIKDGTSNTIAVVEVNDNTAVIWTRPDDYVLPENPLEGLLRSEEQGIIVAMCDGAVYRLSKSIDDERFRKLVSRDGGGSRMVSEWIEFAEPLKVREVKLVDVP
ncbi:MAG: DUF1559 domain-containing protein [Planctomycetota bacterium]|nr:DUF1559 domain-containing protein [Planctomycetota bacterium]